MTKDSTSANGMLANAPAWLAKLGTRSWLVVGVIALAAAATYLLSRASAIVGPLLVAIVLGILFEPIVSILERRGVPRAAGAGITLLLVLVLVGGLAWLMIASLAGEMAIIGGEISKGLEALAAGLAALNIPQATIDAIGAEVKGAAPKLVSLLTDVLFAGVLGIVDMIFAAFMAFYMLFYVLMDRPKLTKWIGSHLGLPAELGVPIADDATRSIGQYFQGTTIVAVVTSAFTGVGCALFHVPLVIPIVIVTFATSYIPYVGVVLGGAFAILIALGAGGFEMALAVFAIVIIAQNFVEAPIAGWAIGAALELHPLVVIISTMVGGIFFGIYGALLASPIVAVCVRTIARLREASAAQPGTAPSTSPAGD